MMSVCKKITSANEAAAFSSITVVYGCFLKWWYSQNSPRWSFLVGKPMVVGYHHFRKPPYRSPMYRSLHQPQSLGTWKVKQLQSLDCFLFLDVSKNASYLLRSSWMLESNIQDILGGNLYGFIPNEQLHPKDVYNRIFDAEWCCDWRAFLGDPTLFLILQRVLWSRMKFKKNMQKCCTSTVREPNWFVTNHVIQYHDAHIMTLSTQLRLDHLCNSTASNPSQSPKYLDDNNEKWVEVPGTWDRR